MKISEILSLAVADGIELSINRGRVKAAPTTKPLGQEFKDAIVANKADLMVAIGGKRHWSNPKTGKRFVTRIAKCQGCRFACWGEIDGLDQWGCLAILSGAIIACSK